MTALAPSSADGCSVPGLPDDPIIEVNAPIPTWFKVGGRASRLCRPQSMRALQLCIEMDPHAKVLGDGANLLVDDEGIDELVISLQHPTFSSTDFIQNRDGGTLVVAGAGVPLPKLITESVRRGLQGLEGLAGIPATLGGALVMNAGGSFGQISDSVQVVHALQRDGQEVRLERRAIPFAYRQSGLENLLITKVELLLTPADPVHLRERLLDVMAYKKKSQPMAENSAGCCFKNPVLPADHEEFGSRGVRVSAGLLIDRTGLKGLRLGSATVSTLHGNFLTADPDGKARDVMMLMDLVSHRVFDRFGIRLVPEVVLWRRS